MNFIRKYLIYIVGLVLLGASFYWFEWRPSQVIKTCQTSAIETTTQKNGDRDDAIYRYKKCMRENGFDK
jgi:hypothetical protein